MSEITNKSEALEALAALQAFVEGLADDGGESAPAAATVTIPTVEEVEALEGDAINEMATNLSIDVEGKKSKVVVKLLRTLAAIAADAWDVDSEDDADVAALTTALGLEADDDVSKNIEAVKEWVVALSGDGTASTEGEAAPAAEDAPAPAAEVSGDGVDRPTVASSFKTFPDLATMVKHLKAYAAVDGATEIEYDAKKLPSVKEAYRSLVAEMVSSSEEVATWGTPYIRDEGGWCCGFAMSDLKVKGEKRQVAKCQVTAKAFAYNEDDGTFVELKLAKK